MELLKPSFYDDFACIAGECSYTCCRDWGISLDDNDINKMRAFEDVQIDANITEKNGQKVIRLNEEGICPYLNEKGLCRMVLRHGEESISTVCHRYPRMCIIRVDQIEVGLCNSCEVVLDMLIKEPTPLGFILEPFENGTPNGQIVNSPQDFRNSCIDILQINSIQLGHRLFLLYLLAKEGGTKTGINRYASIENIAIFEEAFLQLSTNFDAMIKSLSIISGFIRSECGNNESYKKHIEPVLNDLENSTEIYNQKLWIEFKQAISIYDDFFENITVNDAFLTIDAEYDYKKNALSLIIEYVVRRYILFRRWCLNGKQLSKKEMFDIIIFYSRNIRHNNFGMYKFIDELLSIEGIDDGWIFNLINA